MRGHRWSLVVLVALAFGCRKPSAAPVAVASVVAVDAGPTSVAALAPDGGSAATPGTPAPFLLVDHDGSANNGDPAQEPSASDKLFASTLDAMGVKYDTLRISADATTTPLTAAALEGRSAIVWYSGSSYGSSPVMTSAETIILDHFLKQPGPRKLFLFTDALSYDASAFDPNLNWTTVANPFLTQDVGLRGAKADVYNNTQATVTGAHPSTQGLSLAVQATGGPVDTFYNALNPAAGTDTLLTLTQTGCTPDEDIGACSFPVAIGHTFGDGQKKVVAVGFPVEDVVNLGGNTQQSALRRLLSY